VKRQDRRITVKHATESEALNIQRALDDPELRALAITIGALTPFSKPMQGAMMQLIRTHFQALEAKK
jgi:hypothetical protein